MNMYNKKQQATVVFFNVTKLKENCRFVYSALKLSIVEDIFKTLSSLKKKNRRKRIWMHN